MPPSDHLQDMPGADRMSTVGPSSRAKPVDFSVVIPLYNKERFIRSAIRSALAQTNPPVQIIVVDDGSTDAGVTIVQAIDDPRITLVKQPNTGPGRARNRGFAEARCDWVALLDADDIWRPDHLATLSTLILHFPQVDLVATGFRRIPVGSPPPPEPDSKTAGYLLDYFRERAVRECVWTSAAAVRRSAYHDSGGMGDVWPGEDSEFWARFALDHDIAVSRSVTAYYSVDTGGIMHSRTSSAHGRDLLGGNPELATLDRALADPTHAQRHAAIRHLREVTITRMVKHALFDADPRQAALLIAELSSPGGLQLRLYRVLARLPTAAIRPMIASYRTAKRLLGAKVHRANTDDRSATL